MTVLDCWRIDGKPVFLVDSSATAKLQCKELFRQNIPMARFIVGTGVRELLSELIKPTQFQTKTSNYYIYPVENSTEMLQWKSEHGCIIWKDGQLCLYENILCESCFLKATIIAQKICKRHGKKRKAEVVVTPNVRKREKRHVCDHKDCGRAFRLQSDLKRHIRTHTREKPYVILKIV